MALKATIYKATVNVADMDRNVFIDSNLTLARHPSETEERLMLRLLAWLVNAHERLVFTRGLSAEDEPEIWLMNDHNGIELWVDLGLPEERRVKRACNRSASVVLYTYNGRAAQIWWQQNQSKLAQQDNLTIRFIDDEQLSALIKLASRSMTLQATIQDGTIWLSDDQNHLELRFTDWLVNGKRRMIILSRNVTIPDSELELMAIRAQGNGGQNVNKSSTAIHLRFDIRASSLPEFYKERLMAVSHHLITPEGVVIIKAQEYRSQEMNREAALKRLENLIQELTVVEKTRRATRPTLASKKRRLEGKSRKATTKSLRGKMRGAE